MSLDALMVGSWKASVWNVSVIGSVADPLLLVSLAGSSVEVEEVAQPLTARQPATRAVPVSFLTDMCVPFSDPGRPGCCRWGGTVIP